MENFRNAEVTERLGISYEDLKQVKEDIIYASCKGFGNERVMESPYAGRTTTDIVAQAMGGIMQATGFPENGPTKVGPGIGDLFPGTMLTVGILSAIIERDQSGEGQMVDVSMVDGITSLNDTRTVHYAYTGEDPPLPGNSHPYVFPMNVFEAVDGKVVIQASGERWDQLCETIEKPELAEYSSIEERKKNEDYLYEEINQWTEEHTQAEIMEELKFTQVGPVYQASDQFEDEHFYARDMFVDVEHANTGESAKIAGPPVKHSRTTGQIQGRAPFQGEHSRKVLQEIGYSDEKIDSLMQSEVLIENKPDALDPEDT
jgi:succinyl-CoA:mesaconate CoA transferase